MKITRPITLSICINGIEYCGQLLPKVTEPETPEPKTPEAKTSEIKEEKEEVEQLLPTVDESVNEALVEEEEQNSSSASSENENQQMTL